MDGYFLDGTMTKSMFVVIFLFLILACSATPNSNLNTTGTPSPSYITEPLVNERDTGWVELLFDITETGTTDNIQVVASSGSKAFEQQAVLTLSKWKYRLKIENGKPVRQIGQWVRLEFQSE